jgi:hypothetical protein
MNYQDHSHKQVFWKYYRKTNLLIKVSIVSLLLLSSCYELRFTSNNVIKLKTGMTSTEVIEIFGKPKRTSATTCGTAAGKPWSCIIWYYGDITPSLFFSEGPDGVLYLNSWNM